MVVYRGYKGLYIKGGRITNDLTSLFGLGTDLDIVLLILLAVVITGFIILFRSYLILIKKLSLIIGNYRSDFEMLIYLLKEIHGEILSPMVNIANEMNTKEKKSSSSGIG
jgi:hypothetical protein